MSRSQRGMTRWRPVTRWRDAVQTVAQDDFAADLIRYVGDAVSDSSGHPLGIFQVMYQVLRQGDIPAGDRHRLQVAGRWFGEHLARPTRFSHHSLSVRREAIALSWFRSTAQVHVSRMLAVVEILRANGHPIHEVRTRRPGYVTYVDQHQVVAVPFSDS